MAWREPGRTEPGRSSNTSVKAAARFESRQRTRYRRSTRRKCYSSAAPRFFHLRSNLKVIDVTVAMSLFPKAAPEPRQRLADWKHQNPEKFQLYLHTIGLRNLVSAAEKKLTFALGLGDASTWQNSTSTLISMARSDHYDVNTGQMSFRMLSGLKTALNVAEKSEEFRTAVTEYEPLLAAVAALDSAETERERERLMAEAALREARVNAERRLLAQVDNDESVIAAKAALNL